MTPVTSPDDEWHATHDKERSLEIRTGYRDESFGGSEVTDPIRIALFETIELGNVDIIDHMVENPDTFLKDVSPQVRRTLEKALENEDWDETLRKETAKAMREALKAALGDRDFAVWLCAEPYDIFQSYIEPFPEDQHKDRLEEADVWKYEIPDDAMRLSDLGTEGSLFAWNSRHATQGVMRIDMHDVLRLRK